MMLRLRSFTILGSWVCGVLPVWCCSSVRENAVNGTLKLHGITEFTRTNLPCGGVRVVATKHREEPA